MKTKLIFLAFLLFSLLNIKAQCNPTITSPRLGMKYPASILFCDTEDEILSTAQTYAAYQWYKQEWTWQTPNNNPWVPVPGATSQQLTINGNDQLNYYKVIVSEGDCTAESTPVFADGFVYGLPAMMSTYTPGTYEENMGEINVCNGASVQLDNIFPVVYGKHVWFRCVPTSTAPFTGDPCVIPGVSGDTYVATNSGKYGFYACTEYCPDQCQMLDPFAFLQLNFGNWDFCSNLGTGESRAKDNNLKIYPNPTAQLLYIGKESDKVYKEVSIIDMSGKLVLKKNDHRYNQAIDVSQLVPGNYIIVSRSSDGSEYKNRFIKK
ncbi:T9SS type A sorting domain-containing protein [Chryseobacterium sp. Tr-659]|uniref:T9SS type A sorting domain-containing protein n=1 Tax=Chryseobacterium sp. Tr-659 TaxID=2608340 RepID=UPI00141F70C2|nr:T9SS type A sorting domain-containing protein [Chryseobacterium sp. Tr-659]NIF05712.1 T9SS type A sorting domain-containing protein [Chryseobacterium sp. Tr-659]